MGPSHRPRRVGRPRTRGHRKVTSSASQRRAGDANGESALDKSSPCFYEDERVSRRAKQWAENPSTFFREVPQGCAACQLYERIQAVSSGNGKRRAFPPRGSKPHPEETLINTIELRIYMVFFHLLRTKFNELFHANGHEDSLAHYLSAHGFGSRKELSSSFNKITRRGGCYYELTTKTAHRGVLLLSTTLGITTLEAKKCLEDVSNAAAKDIAGIGSMQIYDIAMGEIFNIFETSLEDWCKSIAQGTSPNERSSVQDLINSLQGRNLNDPSLPCARHHETYLAAGSESSFPVQEVLSAVQQTATVAEDVYGAECHFDPSVILLVPDMSGAIRKVTVGALARGPNTHGLTAGTQSNSTYPPSSDVSNQFIYTALQWTNFQG
ncbi:hypothetical protein CDV36_015980 [Fusarium kuroshium]|uniref:Uncharacterized protein n=1 Tax=Fusarium kuroshium TaxID=2010991 RepID=A0A3M2R3I7_9HYPO|nr:hypothetical protein CDV36_015980 [Fusarium kuroshium]